MKPSGTLLKPVRSKATVASLLLGASVVLAACNSDRAHEYLARSDKVTSGAGDAVAANRAIHTISPWSPPSHKTQIDMDGKRAGLAVKRYETNTSPKPKGLNSDTISVEVGPKN